MKWNCFKRIAPVASVCVARAFMMNEVARRKLDHVVMNEWNSLAKCKAVDRIYDREILNFWKISIGMLLWMSTDHLLSVRVSSWMLLLNLRLGSALVGWGFVRECFFSSPVMDYVKNNTYSELGKKYVRLEACEIRFYSTSISASQLVIPEKKNEIHTYLVVHSALSCSVIRKICTWT